MAYTDHFKHADEIVSHLSTVLPSITDPLLKTKYIGFVTVAAVTVYELAIKDIFIEFSHKKHKILGNFTENYFERINGRIKTSVIKDEYLPKFGDKYLKKFKEKLDETSSNHLKAYRRDILNSYANLITWRNDFAHEGKVNTTATFTEIVEAYEDGKLVIKCLAEAMYR